MLNKFNYIANLTKGKAINILYKIVQETFSLHESLKQTLRVKVKHFDDPFLSQYRVTQNNLIIGD